MSYMDFHRNTNHRNNLYMLQEWQEIHLSFGKLRQLELKHKQINKKLRQGNIHQ